MNLEELCKRICTIAEGDALIRSARYGGSVYEINAEGRRPPEFALVYLQPSSPHVVAENTIAFGFNVFYLDRLLDSGDNAMEVQSTAVAVLDNLVKGIADLEGVISVTYPWQCVNYVATEGFADRLAGAYAQGLQVVVVKDTLCHD